MLGDWQQPTGRRLEVRSLDFAHLEAPRVKLGMLEARVLAIHREGQGAGAGDLHPTSQAPSPAPYAGGKI